MTNAWHVLTTVPSGLEADMIIARLEVAEIPAMRDNNDTVGIFGPGFQGATARGVSVLVPEGYAADARDVLEDVGENVVVHDDDEEEEEIVE
ncbi:MAG: DUF2007 domain-containing protein [Gemmatimonadota bacterium]|nr:DUF2007 domain-containing protein [Gemmatimonadota bacterium]MDQ8169026.1 DUF2007 domain-containing protein [Gemmatimonadota bacterium]MDQ8173825.1 DUF2007 domain-containing protein [Gemmatimonadota bacterium]